MENEVQEEPQLQSLAEAAAGECGADILLINAPMMPGLEQVIRKTISRRLARREQVIVILVSAGGLADTAYRSAVALRSYYSDVVVCVSGWCKSAGTLMALGADALIFGCNGEMGPLDVQIAVKDEIVENRDSGLILDAAIEGLTTNSFKVFERIMTSIIERSDGAITFRTAADLAAQMTIGLMSPVFEKIDPLRMGADQRAMKIGRDYAVRLNLKAGNLRGHEALNMLLNGYPSHGFAIDLDEAERLFTHVKPLEGYLEKVVEALDELALVPVTTDRPMVIYLDGAEDAEIDSEEVDGEGRYSPDVGESEGGEPPAAPAEEL